MTDLAGRAAEVGKPAPEFTLPSLDGREVSLSEYLGKRLVLFFWASW